MSACARIAAAGWLCLAAAGCQTTVNGYGYQSGTGGASTTATSTAVVGTARVSGGQASFAYGSVPPPGTPGGFVGFGGSGAVLLGAILIDMVTSWLSSTNRPAPAPAAISHTCSCYGYKPPVSGEQ